jgi:ADP-ribose pyrophosphatase YjhB (NUDIX family)
MRATHDTIHKVFTIAASDIPQIQGSPMPLLRLAKPLVKRLGGWFGLLTRATTLGVRAVVRDDDGRVLLVRHTYLPGWYLPGGGVDPGETILDACLREIAEETGVAVADPPRLFALYFNRRASRRDHVALFVVDTPVGRPPLARPAFEIAEVGFFALDALPADTTAATRRRLAEVFEGAETAAEW